MPLFSLKSTTDRHKLFALNTCILWLHWKLLIELEICDSLCSIFSIFVSCAETKYQYIVYHALVCFLMYSCLANYSVVEAPTSYLAFCNDVVLKAVAIEIPEQKYIPLAKDSSIQNLVESCLISATNGEYTI